MTQDAHDEAELWVATHERLWNHARRLLTGSRRKVRMRHLKGKSEKHWESRRPSMGHWGTAEEIFMNTLQTREDAEQAGRAMRSGLSLSSQKGPVC